MFAYCSKTLSIKAFKLNATNLVLFSFWKFGEILKAIGDQFVKKGSFWRGTHPFVWSLIKEEKETAELLLEYVINTRTLLQFSTCNSEGGNRLWDSFCEYMSSSFFYFESQRDEYLNLVMPILKVNVLILKESFSHIKFSCVQTMLPF